MGFNLIDEPWLPCLLPENVSCDLSLREALVRAQEIRELFDPSPLVTAALHRLLLAVLHRIFGPVTRQDWAELWRRGSLDAAALDAYLNRWRHRFDLFDSERPFYQVPYMDRAHPHPVGLLAMEMTSGNNATLFDHHRDDMPDGMTPAKAARALLSRQLYSIGFGKSDPFYFQDAPLVRGFTVLMLGNSLFETLMANLLPYNNEAPIPRHEVDVPNWEDETPDPPDEHSTTVRGYLHYLTWQSRRIHLIKDNDFSISQCQIQQNLKLPSPPPLDPFKCFRRDEKEGWMPLGFRPEKALWRDSHTLFDANSAVAKRPDAFDHLALARQRDPSIRAVWSFSAIGFATEPGKAASVILWRHERLPLPLVYIENVDLRGVLREALDLADRTAEILDRAIRRLTKELLMPETDPNKLSQSARDVVRRRAQGFQVSLMYWPRLELEFRRFLVDLATDRTQDDYGDAAYGRQARPAWANAVKDAADGAFNEIANGVGDTPRSLRATALAQQGFRGGLAGLMKQYMPEAEPVAAGVGKEKA